MKIISNVISANDQAKTPEHFVMLKPQSEDKSPIGEIPFPSFVVEATTPLSWRNSHIYSLVKEVRINQTIKDLMNDDVSFANWVRTIISCHISLNPLDAIEYPAPDQFRDDYGIMYLTVETFSKTVLDSAIEGRRRPQPELKEATIHVLA